MNGIIADNHKTEYSSQDKKVALVWAISGNPHISHFEIERALDKNLESEVIFYRSFVLYRPDSSQDELTNCKPVFNPPTIGVAKFFQDDAFPQPVLYKGYLHS